MLRIGVFSVVIAALDTLALLVLFDLVATLRGGQPTRYASWIPGVQTEAGSSVGRLMAVTAGLFLARSMLSVVELWLSADAGNKAQEELTARLLRAYVRAPHVVRLERGPATTLRTLLTSTDDVTRGIMVSAISLTGNVAIIVATVVGLVIASPLVAFAVFSYFAVLAYAWLRVTRTTLRRRGQRLSDLHEQRARYLLQSIAASKELQLRGRSVPYANRTIDRTAAIHSSSRVVQVLNGSLRYVFETALVLGAVLVVAVAGARGGQNAALPAVGLVLAAAFRLLPALNRALFVISNVQVHRAALDVVEDELAVFGPSSDDIGSEETAPHDLRDAIRLEDVVFRYRNRTEPALRGVSLEIRAGESVGILGPTGSGKSTLLDVILGMLEPESGTITVDGTAMSGCRDAWQRSIGYVAQDVTLLDDSLAANVALGWERHERDDRRIDEALEAAQLDDVVAALPAGVETMVGERGVRLSGGQRQRVALARALYVRPSVLVLDEATSNLDPETEARVVATLNELHGKLTMIIVTHRLSTVRRCDHVVYVEQGRVRAHGTFEEVCRAVPGLLLEAQRTAPLDPEAAP